MKADLSSLFISVETEDGPTILPIAAIARVVSYGTWGGIAIYLREGYYEKGGKNHIGVSSKVEDLNLLKEKINETIISACSKEMQ